MTFDEQRYRYENDPLFCTLVQTLQRILHEGKLTVGELKDAVSFADILFKTSCNRPPLFRKD